MKPRMTLVILVITFSGPVAETPAAGKAANSSRVVSAIRQATMNTLPEKATAMSKPESVRGQRSTNRLQEVLSNLAAKPLAPIKTMESDTPDPAEISKLRTQLEDLRTQLDQVRQTVAAPLEARIEALQRQAEEDKATIRGLDASMQELHRRLNEKDMRTRVPLETLGEQALAAPAQDKGEIDTSSTQTQTPAVQVAPPDAADSGNSEQPAPVAPPQTSVEGATPATEDVQDVPAEGATEAKEDDSEPADTLTNGFWGLSDALANHGLEVAMGSTNVYQANVRDGLGTHQKAGRLTGSYDLELAADLEKMFGITGLGLFVHGEGGWPATAGIDETMVGSVSGVNADAIGDRSLDLIEVLFEWSLFDNFLTLKVGKMDFAGVFDTSEYANDETSQFLNGALVNNLTIPLPEYCLGVVVSAALSDHWHVSAGVGDAQADGRETGFRTAFGGEDYFFYSLETGITAECRSSRGPLTGNYRVGAWYDPQPKAHSDSEEAYRDDLGIYASLDQVLVREDDDPENSQGLGIFARYGYADEKRNDISGFWSVGFQYQGLFGGRDDDVLGLGVAQSTFSDLAAETFPADYESVTELYYNARVAPGVAISPHMQYLSNPGGNKDVGDALVVGARAQVDF